MSQPFRRDRARLPAAERRKQIVEVTSRLIAEYGFWGLSMQDVADGCGLTVPGLLHHVGSKEGLLIAVLEERDRSDMTEMTGQDLKTLCASLVRRNARQPEIVRLFAVLDAESLAPDHPAHDYFRTRERRAIASFTELAGGDEALARQVVAMMDGLQIQWLRDPAEADLVKAWDDAAERLFSE
ncbi:TetR/AcrR family transcriptional regulator [Actinoplanes sp. NPDC048796]|uniref:TetR/AcrR family transcriptional regulator n=1 Tax=unclassified Actinoplanes TaxID=2626549 RepID=UPI0033E9462F